MEGLNIGNFYAELSIDTSKLTESKKKAIKELEELKKEGEEILKNAGDELSEKILIKIEKLEKNKQECIQKIDELDNEIKQKHNKNMQDLAEMINASLTAPLKAFAEDAIATFANFEQSMQNTFSVMGASSTDMELLTNAAKEMGETTRFSASQASAALYSLGSAGQNASEAVNSLKGVLSLAGATGSDLAFTSETIAQTLSQFNLEASKASHIADVYSKAIGKSQASMGKLAYSMKYVGPVASGLGISLESTTAALMKLYNTGYGGEQAGNYLKSAFQKLASGTQDLKTKLQELGITYEEVNPQTRNFADIIQTLKEKNVGVTESIDIFGDAAGGAMAKLIQEGGEALHTMEGLLKSSDGAALEMQKIQNTSFANTRAELSSALEAVEITIGGILAPALDIIVKGFTSILKTVNSLPIGVQTFVTALSTAAAALGPFLLVPALIAKIKTAMTLLNIETLKNPIFLMAGVVAGVAAAVYSTLQQVRHNQQAIVNEAKKGIDDIKEMQEKANEAGAKNKAIEELLSKYESLRNNTAKTKEEQEEYNNTLTRLTELVPNVITKVDATGQAYIDNIEKIKLASLEQLQLEQQQNAMALQTAQNRKQLAMSTIRYYEGKIKEAEEKRNKTNNTKEPSLYELQTKYDEMKAKGDKELDDYLRGLKIRGERVAWVSLRDGTILSGFKENKERFQEIIARELTKDNQYLNQLDEWKDIVDKSRMTVQNIEKLESDEEVRKEQIEKLKNKQLETLKSKKDIIKAFEEEAKKQAKNAKEISLGQGNEKSIADKEEIETEIKVLTKGLEDLRALKKGVNVSEDINFSLNNKGVFNDEDLKRVQSRLRVLKKTLNDIGKTKVIVKPEVKIKTLDDELKKLDSLYKEKIALAKEYGKKQIEVEAEWASARKKLIDEELKKENITEKSATGGSGAREGITINDELEKTREITFTAFERAKKEYAEKNSELEDVLAQLESAKEHLRIAETQGAEGEKDEDAIKLLNNHIEGLEKKAKSISEEVGKTYYTFSDINNLIDSFNGKSQTSYTSKFKEIANAKKEALKAIEDAKNKNSLSSEQAEKATARLKKEAKKATALVGLELTNSIISVGNATTDIILNAIEKGTVSLEGGLNMVSQMASQISNMMPDPISKAVVGGISMITKFIGNIINYNKKRKEEEERALKKAREEEDKKQKQKADEVAGKEAENYARQLENIKKKTHSMKDVLNNMLDNIKTKKIEDAIARLKDMQTDEYDLSYEMAKSGLERHGSPNGFVKEVEDEMRRKGYSDWSGDQMFRKMSYNELITAYNNAIEKGDDALAQNYRESLNHYATKYFNEKGISLEEVDGLKNYVKGINDIVVNAIRSEDLSTLGVALKEKLRDGIIEKLKTGMLFSNLNKLINEYGATNSEERKASLLKAIEEEGERVTKAYQREAEKLTGALGLMSSEMDEHVKAWAGMKKSIKDALSTSLGEAAYNADWDSFKKGFASEMKKAIISAAIANAGIKGKVDGIIKGIMKDGKITAEEIDKSINDLSYLFDGLEGNLAGLSKITKALEKGTTVKHESSGTVIQKLSGADRDWFTEVFKENFKVMSEGFKSAMIELREIHNAHITVLQASLTVNNLNVLAQDGANIKDLIAEMIKSAQQGA